MKKSRSWLATLLSVCLLITMLSVASFAAADGEIVVEAEAVHSSVGAQHVTTENKTGSGYSGGAYSNVFFNGTPSGEIRVRYTLTVDQPGLYG
ncbi:MAG: hypothetical protein ACOYJY_07875, partial [Acutalibacteraceae bacterium]